MGNKNERWVRTAKLMIRHGDDGCGLGNHTKGTRTMKVGLGTRRARWAVLGSKVSNYVTRSEVLGCMLRIINHRR